MVVWYNSDVYNFKIVFVLYNLYMVKVSVNPKNEAYNFEESIHDYGVYVKL